MTTVGGSYSSFTGVSARAASDVTTLKKSVGRISAEQKLTSLLTRSFGVFKTEQLLGDGSTVYYLHDRPELSDSVNIWKLTGSAFAVSSDGGKTWNAGVDAEGNVVMNILSAIGIDASWIKAVNLDAISANLGGWEIKEGALFKEYTYDGKIVRVYINAADPFFTSITNWNNVIRVKESTDGGNTFRDRLVIEPSSIQFSSWYDSGSLKKYAQYGVLGIVYADFTIGKRIEIDATGVKQYSF